jgi:hypothetical protein
MSVSCPPIAVTEEDASDDDDRYEDLHGRSLLWPWSLAVDESSSSACRDSILEV